MTAPAAPRAPGTPSAPGALDRVLRLFAEVRPGEAGMSLLLAANVFLLLTTYYIIKPVREALILTGGGAELKSYLSTGQAFLLLGVVPLYASLAGRVSRRRLINTVTLFFAACLVLFFFLARLNVPLGVVFFLWVGIFNLMVVAQFWAFANDLHTEEAGRRLFPIIAIGASAGAALGSGIAALLIRPLGVFQLLLLAAAILLASLLLTNRAEKQGRKRDLDASARQATGASANLTETPAPARTAPSEEPMGRSGAFQLVLRSRYLLGIAFLMLMLNWVNTNGEYLLGRTVRTAAAAAVAAGTADGLSEREYIGRFYSQFFSAVNVAGLLAQMFLVSRILKLVGVRFAVLVLPLIAIGGNALLFLYPVLSVVRWSKTAENATDYSLNNTVRNILFLPTSREQKYKAKQAIDTFFVRTGDVLSSGLVFVGTSLLVLETRQFALVNLGLAVLWLVLAGFVGRSYRRMAQGAIPAPAANPKAAGG